MESLKVCKGVAKVILAESSLEFLESRYKSVTEGIHDTIHRYEAILMHTELPMFNASEIELLLFATGTVLCLSDLQPGMLLQEVTTCLTDSLTGEADEADAALIAKIARLTFVQEVTLLDRLEQRRIYITIP